MRSDGAIVGVGVGESVQPGVASAAQAATPTVRAARMARLARGRARRIAGRDLRGRVASRRGTTAERCATNGGMLLNAGDSCYGGGPPARIRSTKMIATR